MTANSATAIFSTIIAAAFGAQGIQSDQRLTTAGGLARFAQHDDGGGFHLKDKRCLLAHEGAHGD